jgi:hypothetical protein
MTEHDARAAFKFWCDRLYSLQKATYPIALKCDALDYTKHLEQVRIATVNERHAFEELQAARGIAVPPRRPVVRLGA